MDVCFHVRDVRELYVDVALQAHKSTDGSLANSMFLPLAEKLMEKYVAEKKLDVEEGLLSLPPLCLSSHVSLFFSHSSYCIYSSYSLFFLVPCCECCDAVTVWTMLVNYDQPMISKCFLNIQ